MTRDITFHRRAVRERTADRTAALALSSTVVAGRAAPRRSLSSVLAAKVKPDGQVALEAVREPLRAAYGHDFSNVRVHASGTPSVRTQALGARALTYGREISFAPGEWAPMTGRGRALLAHELAHVAMQGREGVARADASPLDQELDAELQKHAESDPKTLDPDHPEYARTLQDYGHKLTHQSQTELLGEPTDKKAKAEWRRKFAKSELLASRILSRSGPKVEQKDSRGQMLASDLAQAGFVDEAMALARRIVDGDTRSFVYVSAMNRPDKVTPGQMAEISKFYVSRQIALTDHPVLVKLRSDEGAYTKQLGPQKEGTSRFRVGAPVMSGSSVM